MDAIDSTKDSPDGKRAAAGNDSDRDTAAAPVPEDGVGKDAGGAAGAEQDEVGGPSGPEPTRFGDWERKGRCIDF